MLASRPHPEQGFRTCLGILRSYRGLDRVRVEAVSARAVELRRREGDAPRGEGREEDPASDPMFAHPTLDQLNALGLYGLAKGFKELEHKAEARGLDHAEWLGLLLEYELTLRRQKQFETRARVAKLRHPASVEDVNYQSPRGLDRALFLKLAACDWIAERRNLLLTGASGLAT